MTGKGNGVVGGGGGGGGGIAGYATQAWVNENYLSIEFFSKLFKTYDSAATPNEIKPNDTQSTITNIKAMFGFWTQQYISALGQNPGGGGTGLNEPLASINVAELGVPTASGQVLTWNGTQWIYNIPGGGGGGGTGTVTSITAGTGLSGGTITTMGTIAINSTYQGYIQHGETAYGWGNHASAGYSTPSSVASQMQTYAKIQNGTITIGDNSITPLTQHQTVSGTFWGQLWGNGGAVSGDMTGVGTIKMTGHLYMHEGGTGIYLNSDGTGIDWHDTSDSYVASLLAFTSSMVTAQQGLTIPVNKSLRIGDGVLTWDAANNAFKVEKYDGTAANFYATGGVSSLGVSTGGSVTNLTVSNDLTLGGDLTFGTNDASIYMDDYFYIESGSTVSINGVECYSGNVWLNRLYLDTSRYLYVSGGNLYYYNGSESKKIAFTN